MNSINEIAKYKYEFNNNSPVNLDEYIVLYDEALDERYLLFKLYNNLSERLKHAECEVKIYNENDFLVEDIKFSFDGDFDGIDYFVPELKLKINSEITSLKFNVTFLEFENVKFEDGELKKIPQTLDDFLGDEAPTKVEYKKQNKWTKKQDKLKYKTTKKVVKQDNKRKYITNVTKTNKTKAPIIWTVIFSILVVAYFAASIIIYGKTTNVLSDNYCDYRSNGGYLTLVDNYNQTRKLSIPDNIEGRTVSFIEKAAFKGNEVIEEITLSSYVEIGDSAFEGCKNLKYINNPQFITKIGKKAFAGTGITTLSKLENVTYIGSDAFPENSLEELYVPNAVLTTNSLSGFTSLKTLDFNRVESAKSFLDIFGGSNKSSDTLSKVVTRSDIAYNLFDGFDKIKNVTLYGDNTTFRSKLLTNNSISYLRINASSKTIADRLGITSKAQGLIGTLHINIGKNYNSALIKGMSIQTLVIDSGTLTTDILKQGVRIKTLYIGNNVDYSTVDFNTILSIAGDGQIDTLLFEGNAPTNISKNGYKVSGNVNRSQYGIEA